MITGQCSDVEVGRLAFALMQWLRRASVQGQHVGQSIGHLADPNLDTYLYASEREGTGDTVDLENIPEGS